MVHTLFEATIRQLQCLNFRKRLYLYLYNDHDEHIERNDL